MRIGIVIDEFDPARGGMEEWCRQFVDAVARRGHELHVITHRFGEAALPAQIVQHLVPKAKSRFVFADAAAERRRKLRLDVVHDMGAGWHCDIFQPHTGSFAATLERKLAMHGRWFGVIKRRVDVVLPRRRELVRLWEKQYSRSDPRRTTFAALSKFVADDFVRFHGVRPEQIEIVYNGVDCERFSPNRRKEHRAAVRSALGVEDGKVLLLLLASNFRLKGVPELLRSAGRLVQAGERPHVAIVGGKRLGGWKSYAERLGLGSSVSFVGLVADSAPYLAAADVYVHPTYYDPCSLVILEAAASGLPIVTTRRCNGAAELFRDGEEILTVADPNDAAALDEHLSALMDERLRIDLGAAARAVALRHPLERNVAEILRLYDLAADRRLAA